MPVRPSVRGRRRRQLRVVVTNDVKKEEITEKEEEEEEQEKDLLLLSDRTGAIKPQLRNHWREQTNKLKTMSC